MNDFETYITGIVERITRRISGLSAGDPGFNSSASAFLPSAMLEEECMQRIHSTSYQTSLSLDGFEDQAVYDDEGEADYSHTLLGAVNGQFSHLVNVELGQTRNDRSSIEYVCKRAVWNTGILREMETSEEESVDREAYSPSPWNIRTETLCSQMSLALNDTDDIALCTRIGVYLDSRGTPHPLPTNLLHSDGVIPRGWGSNPIFNRSRIFQVPAKEGYSRGARYFKWFGSHLKTIGKDSMEGDPFSVPLSEVVRLLRDEISDLIGDATLFTSAMRPLAQTQVSLEFQGARSRIAWADVWPVATGISLAIALPSVSERGTRVKNFYNWTGHRRIGKVHDNGKTVLGSASLAILLGGGRAADYLSASAPEPLVNLTSHRLNALLKHVRKTLLHEESSLYVLEGTL